MYKSQYLLLKPKIIITVRYLVIVHVGVVDIGMTNQNPHLIILLAIVKLVLRNKNCNYSLFLTV